MKVFEPFRLDTVNHCLWRAETRMPLTPKAFDVLRYLAEHINRLVTQDEILEALWPGTYVNPEGVRKYILEIRKVLGDRPKQPLFIETLPKRGYQFIAKVTDEQTVAQPKTPSELAANVVGRDAAIAQLHRHFETARTGQRQVIFVTGEAGIGKTTLVDVFQQQAARHPNPLVARGQCIDGFGGTEAYYPVLEAVSSLISRAKEGYFFETLAKLAPTWLAQFPSLVKAEQKDALQREILGSTRGRMVREICEALEALSLKHPLVMVLEDLHWADTSTLDLISAFARRREPANLLFVGTYRPVDAILLQSPIKALKQDLLVRHLCNEVSIECLDDFEVAEYLTREFVHNDFPPELANLIHHNSGGNALFMVTIVRDIVKRSLIVQNRGTWTLGAPIQDIYPGIPETLQELLDTEFEQLSPEEQRVLESCSVAGERFSVWTAAVMLNSSVVSIEETCDKLARRQQFIRSSGIHEVADGTASPHYEFRHSLYRQALYHRLSSVNRSKLHLSLGEGLMAACGGEKPELASELALHFEKGRDYQRAARYLMLAAENAANRFSQRDAIRILRLALKLVSAMAPGSKPELEIEILQRIGDTHYVLGEMSDSVVAYEAAVELAKRAGLKRAHTRALVHLGFPAWYVDTARGSNVCRQAIEISENIDDPLLAAQTRLAVAGFRFVYETGRGEDAEVCSTALETIRHLSGSSTVHDGYIYVQAFQGDYQEAQRQADAMIKATANRLGRVPKFLILLASGRFGDLLRMVRTGKELEEKNGEDPWISVLGESWLRMQCYDFEGVSRLSKIVMRSNAEQHATWMRTVSRISSGYAELYRGNAVEALRCFSQVRDPRITSNFILHWRWRLHAQLGMAEARLQAADFSDAHREADDLLAAALSATDPNMHALAWEMKSRVASAERNLDSARPCIDNALAIVDNFDIPLAAWQVYGTASDLYGQTGQKLKAEEHCARAHRVILSLADSFEPGEPLRDSLMGAAPVRRVLHSAFTADFAAS